MRPTPTIALALVTLLVVVGSAQATSQSWYLLSDGSSATTLSGTETDFRLANSQSRIWIVSTPADMDVDLSGTWQWEFIYDQNELVPNTYLMRVGNVTPDGAFHSAGSTAEIRLEEASGRATSTGIGTAGFVVREGEKLGFEILNVFDALGGLNGGGFRVVQSHLNTRFISPVSDPGYPTPELGTLILVAVGLVGALAVLGVRRR